MARGAFDLAASAGFVPTDSLQELATLRMRPVRLWHLRACADCNELCDKRDIRPMLQAVGVAFRPYRGHHLSERIKHIDKMAGRCAHPGGSDTDGAIAHGLRRKGHE